MTSAKKILLFISDIFCLYLALFLTLLIRYGIEEGLKSLAGHLLPFSLIFSVWLIIFYLADLYQPQTLRGDKLFFALVLSAGAATLVSMVVFYLLGGFFRLTPKTNLLIFAFTFILIDYFWRRMLIKFFISGASGVIILGTSPLVKETTEYLRENPQTGYFLYRWIKEVEKTNIEEAAKDIKEKRAEIVVIVEPHLTKEMMTDIAREILPLGAGIFNAWDFYELIFEKVPLEELEESWILENIITRRPIYDTLKRFFDFILACFLAAMFLPLALLIALTIKLTSRGPAIFKQKRLGKNGLIFNVYKFRTMTHNASGPLWTERKDSRLTFFGKILRFTHLDELPQLWNIIKGEMSFTGPRPERIELVQKFQSFPYYHIRQIVKPGLSGWAQIKYRPSASLEEALEKLRYEIFYIKNRSLFLDLKIILKTIKYLLISHQ